MTYSSLLLTISLLVFYVAADASGAYPAPPKPVATDISVGVYIFPGWYRHDGSSDYPYKCHDDVSEWRNAISKVSKPRPVLGFYDDSLPEVNDWHIKWAREAGISWFAFDWYWNAGEKRLSHTLEKGFLKSRYCNEMQFCINWCNHGLDYKKPLDFSPKAMEEVIRYCADNYFVRPNYFKINGRPVFMIYIIEPILTACGGADKFQLQVLPRLSTICHEHGLGDLFLIWDSNDPGSVSDVPVGDAFTSYSYHWVLNGSSWTIPGSAPYSEIVEGVVPIWQKMLSTKNNKQFIVGAQAGWDDSPRRHTDGNNWVRTGLTIDLFEKMLRNGKSLVRPEFPYFMIEAWNEWGEGSYLEPSKEYGFGHLDAIRRVFGGKSANNWARPTPEQVHSYSVLSDEELAAAKKCEDGPPVPVFIANRSVAYFIDPAELPGKMVSEWTSSMETAGVGWSDLSEDKSIDGKSVYEITNGDPFMVLPGEWGPISGIAGIAYRVRITNTGSADSGNFFWETDKSRIGSDTCLVKWKCDGSFHTYLFTYTSYASQAESLKHIRADFPSMPGGKVEIEWIRVYGRK